MPTPRAGYHLKDGTRVPGVTTILGRWKESGGLLQWAFKQGQSGAASLYDERDKAADIGTLAHAMVDAFISKGDEKAVFETASAEQKPKVLQAYNAFRSWFDQQRCEVISAETPMVSESLRFGGTPDAVFRMPDGLLAMGDWKTSNGIYRDHLMQVAAYGLLWAENHDEPITGGFHVCRFSKEYPDFEHRYFGELDGALELFKLLRGAYDLDAQLKKRCA